MSAQQFMEALFGKLPESSRPDEKELYTLWSAPDTRKKLLKAFPRKAAQRQLAEIQQVIGAEKSGLFNVLAHVAYALEPLTREERAAQMMTIICTLFQESATGLP